MSESITNALTPSPTPPTDATKKKQVRRATPDLSQRTRLIVQSLFILLNVFLCVQFYFFVRYFESDASGSHVSRPAGVDGWLPIAGLMNTRYFFATGHIPAIHPAAMILFLIFVVMSLVLKRAFCSWLCPVGTLSEYLWKAGRKLLGRNIVLPRWLDIPLRGIKYLLMAFFVFIIGGMSAASLEDFMVQPYGILADVKMLHFFLHMSGTALIELTESTMNITSGYFFFRAAISSIGLITPVEVSLWITVRASNWPVASFWSTAAARMGEPQGTWRASASLPQRFDTSNHLSEKAPHMQFSTFF